MNMRVQINSDQCRRVGSTLSALKIKPSFYERPFLAATMRQETRLRMMFNVVAICHQTHNLAHAGLNLYGWDYLEKVFVDLALTKSWILNPESVVNSQKDELKTVLLTSFSPDGNQENSTLDRIDERIELFKELNSWVLKNFKGLFTEFLKSTEGRLFNNGRGYYESLSVNQAFADASRKKASFLYKLLFDAKLFQLVDPENFVPIMDYHMQRVLLRMGCVEIHDPELSQALINQSPLPTDEPVRSACIQALQIISDSSMHKVWDMNDFFWPLGRSCCNETQLCTDGHCIKNPCTFDQIIDLQSHTNCAFAGVCPGKANHELRKLREPNVLTHYY